MKKNNKPISYIILTITIIVSIAYLVFSIFNSKNIIDPLSSIINALLLSIFSIFFIITTLFIDTKGKIYMYITSLLLTIFLSFNLLLDANLLQLPKPDIVNDFTNISIAEALSWATGHQIEVEQVYEPSDTVPIHHIISQTVTAGTLTKEITKITFIISTGPNYEKELIIPNMLGWNIDEVLSFIDENHLNNITIEYELDNQTKDLVIAQDKNGMLRRNDALKLTFSLGSKEDLIPLPLINFAKLKLFDATLWLKRNGFNYNLTYEFSDAIERHNIISQEQDSDSIQDPNTDTINLIVSKGKKIIVPALLEMDITEVTTWIMANNLTIEFSDQYDDTIILGKIISTNYKENDEIEEGTLIKLITSKGPLKMEEFTTIISFRSWASKYNIPYEETYQFHDTIPNGHIISFSHATNEIISNNATILVNVSQGAAIVIPNFFEKSKTYITNTCKTLGLTCSFTYGNYSATPKDNALYQSKTSGSKVIQGTSVIITLSKGPAQKFTLILQETLYTYGNSTASINSLKKYLATNYPGVDFNVVKKAHHLNSGLPHPDSPAKTGITIEQGKTYTIWVIE